MNATEFSVSNVVGELVKNSIDAQCKVIQVEFNGSFDIRVIDDGCGFDEQTMQDIGERQLLLSESLQKSRFRYGKHGKFLLMIAQETAEIFIESIKHNTDVRLYKTIVANESVYKVYETNRSYKDAVIKTDQGSMVVLNTLKTNIGDAVQAKSNIVNSVVELALINFEVEVSVRDIGTQQTLYECYGTKNLFDKFEQFLESQQFFSKIQSVSCEKSEVKVELFLCEDGISSKAFQFVYFNKLCELDVKWRKFVNKLCKKRFEKDLNAKNPVYLLNIWVEKYMENQLAYNLVIDKCIRKCVEQLSKTIKPTNGLASQNSASNAAVSNNEAVVACGKANQDENVDKGVRLGDWIFNNSCEDYEQLNLGREVYRKKICENWVISLEKPKPKDANDSLRSVAVKRTNNNIQKDDHLFKKPKPKPRPANRKIQKVITKATPLTGHVSSQIYKPSQHVKDFNNSGLIRASKKLISKTSTDKKRKISTKNRISSQLEFKSPTRQRDPGGHDHKKTFENVNPPPLHPSNRMDILSPATIENLNDNIRNSRDLGEALKPPIRRLTTTKNTLDVQWHKQATNFNMNFTSSIAIHTINEDDPFTNFLGNDSFDNNSMMNLFGPSSGNDVPTRSHTQFESNRQSGGSASVYSETSKLRYQHNRNDSIHTHYSQRTYRNFIRDGSLNANRGGSVSSAAKNSRPKSIADSSNSGTAIAPRQTSPLNMLSDNVRQTGWPVTININFGQPK